MNFSINYFKEDVLSSSPSSKDKQFTKLVYRVPYFFVNTSNNLFFSSIADPDPEPSFHFDADPDPNPVPQQSEENLRPLHGSILNLYASILRVYGHR
jgi:hypothetical protein